MLKELLISVLVGMLVLIGINFIGQFFNFYIPINAWTILITGIFKIPGFIFVLLIILL